MDVEAFFDVMISFGGITVPYGGLGYGWDSFRGVVRNRRRGGGGKWVSKR